MNLRGVLGGIILASMQCVHTLDFISKDFEKFITTVVAKEYQKDYTEYYTRFKKTLHNLGKTSVVKKNATVRRLRELACCNLENKHPDWAQQLKPFEPFEKDEKKSNEDQLKSIRIFLKRYAVYEEFLKNRAQERASTWYRFKSYSKRVSSKVATFLTGSKEKERKA